MGTKENNLEHARKEFALAAAKLNRAGQAELEFEESIRKLRSLGEDPLSPRPIDRAPHPNRDQRATVRQQESVIRQISMTYGHCVKLGPGYSSPWKPRRIENTSAILTITLICGGTPLSGVKFGSMSVTDTCVALHGGAPQPGVLLGS